MLFLTLTSVLVVVRAGLVSHPKQEVDIRKSCSENFGNDGCDAFELCCDGQCIDFSDGCLDVSGDTLLGIGIAALVAIIVVPILCICCCGGCALYWCMKRRKARKPDLGVYLGQQQPGVSMQPDYHYQPGAISIQQPGMPGVSMQYVVGQDKDNQPAVSPGHPLTGYQ